MGDTTTTKLVELEKDERFDFKIAITEAPAMMSKLVITSSGGPFAQVQAALFDVNDKVRAAVGDLDSGPPLSTADTGEAVWEFSTAGCKGGYLKWRVWPVVAAAGLRTYHITEVVLAGDATRRATVSGTIPDGQTVGTPFIDGVMIS
jgi:hypothetical protein